MAPHETILPPPFPRLLPQNCKDGPEYSKVYCTVATNAWVSLFSPSPEAVTGGVFHSLCLWLFPEVAVWVFPTQLSCSMNALGTPPLHLRFLHLHLVYALRGSCRHGPAAANQSISLLSRMRNIARTPPLPRAQLFALSPWLGWKLQSDGTNSFLWGWVEEN